MVSKNYAAIAVLAVLVIASVLVLRTGMNLTGRFATPTNVGILEQGEVWMYEQSIEDSLFEIDSGISGTQLAYNGTYGGTKAGYDSFDNIAQLFTLENSGSITVDVLMSAKDFSGPNGYVDVGIYTGSFEVYIPEVGWKRVPDYDSYGNDWSADTMELCIANDLLVGAKIEGFDFRVGDIPSRNYTSTVRITSFNSATSNPCSEAGTYVDPG